MEYRKLTELKKLEGNPRVIRGKQFKALVESIKANPQHFEARPLILSNRTGELVIIAGNQRYEAAKSLKLKEVPTFLIEGLTEAKEKEIVIRDNVNNGEWDMDALSAWDNLPLADWGVEIPEDWLKEPVDEKKEEDLLSTQDEDIKGLGMVYDLRADIKFDGVGLFDFPEIKKEMILDIDNLSTWAGPNATHTEPPYLYNYATDSTINLPWDRTVISFYTDDSRFERLWENTSEVVKRMLNKQVIGCFSPNYSTYFSYPKALRIYNIFRSRWVARYMQEAGIRVIPDITCGIGDIDCVCDGIPNGAPIAMQAHRKYNDQELLEKKEIITHVVNTLNPSVIWLYATVDRLEMFPILKKYNIKILIPRTILQHEEKKRKEVK